MFLLLKNWRNNLFLLPIIITLLWQSLLFLLYLNDLINYNPYTTVTDIVCNFLFIFFIFLLFENILFSLFLISFTYLSGVVLYYFTKKNLTIEQLENIPEMLLTMPWYTSGYLLIFITTSVFAMLMGKKFIKSKLELTPRKMSIVIMMVGTSVFYFNSATVFSYIRGHNTENFNKFATWKYGGQLYSVLYHFTEAQYIKEKLENHNHQKYHFSMESSKYELGDKNIYLVVLESYVPYNLIQSDIREDNYLKSLDFNMIWAESPINGGGSAASEFEVLCGIPETQAFGDLTFNNLGGKNSDMCLPNKLKQNAYSTIAITGTLPHFHNAQNAYKTIGFDRHYSKQDIDTNDYDGVHPSDNSIFDFALGKINAVDRKQFIYIFTAAGHKPYDLNKEKRPPLTGNKYLDRVHYTELALLEFLKTLIEADPEAYIVVLGDHSVAEAVQISPLLEEKTRSIPVFFRGFISGTSQVSQYYEIPHFILGNKSELLFNGRQTFEVGRNEMFPYKTMADYDILTLVKLSQERGKP